MLRIIIYFSILFNINGSYSQTVNSIPIPFNDNFIFNKIAWVDNNKYCVVADILTSEKIPHCLYIYDSTGKIIHGPIKFKSRSSSQSDFFFVLGNTCFFVEAGKDDMGGNLFSIGATITGNGVLNDTLREIFYIRGGNENKLLFEASYNFKAYPGINHSKAILAYNNNYIDPIPEGFRFKIIDADKKLSSEDTLKLPYSDQECNINDVVFDDKNELVYLLCDRFNIISKNEKTFKYSFVCEYNINSKSIKELTLSEVSFNKNKIQHLVHNDQIAFTGFYLNQINPNICKASFVIFNKSTFTLKNANEFYLDSNIVGGFFNNKSKPERNKIYPINFSFDREGNLYAGWLELNVIITQINDQVADQGVINGNSVLLFGLAGALIASHPTSRSQYPHAGKAISLKYSPIKGSLKQDTIYSSFSYATFPLMDTVVWLINKPIKDNIKKSSLYIYLPDDTTKNYNYLMTDLKSPINVINPNSIYSTGKKNCFIGKYDPRNDTDSIKQKEQYYIIEIE